MKRITLSDNSPQTICWINNRPTDWAKIEMPGSSGMQFTRSLGFPFDAAVSSEDGQYVFIYQKLGTKAVLMKDGHELREINRPYYCSDVHEYPATLATLKNGRTYLIHCPFKYCRLDFEDVETGEIVTNVPGRDPRDFFHSRLAVGPESRYLLSDGWFWHPWGVAKIFDLEACLADPLLLDIGSDPDDLQTEICSASFIDMNTVLLGTSNEPARDEEEPGKVPPLHLAIWDIPSNQITHVVKPQTEFGQLYAIDEERCFDTFRYPKIINLRNGEVEDKAEDIFSGLINHAIISSSRDQLPQISFNRSTKQLAIVNKVTNSVEILSP